MSLSAWLPTMSQWLSAVLVIGFFVLFGVVLLLIVRRLVPHSVLKPHNDIAGFVFATLGVIYGVILAFVVVDVWEQYDRATEISEQESTEAAALYRDLHLYTNRDEADKALATLRVFTLAVVYEEFPAIKEMRWDSGHIPSQAATAASSQLWQAILRIVPRNLHEQSLFNEILADMNDIEKLRMQRHLIARTDLPGVVWAVVILGGLITVGFTALFGHENLRGHLLLAVLLAIVVGSAIEVIVSLNFPFIGEVSIRPEGYEYLIELAGW
jgi:uncharacterized membrane protein